MTVFMVKRGWAYPQLKAMIILSPAGQFSGDFVIIIITT